jgi:peptidoglycan/LPS O-acetylase OafA/YrhL
MISHYQLVPTISAGLWTGVDLFFVISGFLISSLLFKEITLSGTLDLRRFYIRRVLRILPTFYLYIAGTVVLFSVINKDFSASTIISELLFLQNYFTSFNEHTWSLAVEEHFYLFFLFFY